MKKLLSIILVLAMIASLFANVGVVFAVDSGVTLQSVMEFTYSGEYDLDGGTYQVGNEQITVDGVLTIKNGTIDISDVLQKANSIFYLGSSDDVLNLENVNVIGSNYSSAYGVIYAQKGVVNISDCRFELKNELGSSGGVLKGNAYKDSKFVVKNSEFVLENANRVIANTTVDIDNSSIDAVITDATGGYGILVNHAFRNVYGTITNSEIYVDGHETGIKNDSAETLTIDGDSAVVLQNSYVNDLIVTGSSKVVVAETATVAAPRQNVVAGAINGEVTTVVPVAGLTGEGTEASPYLIDSLTALKWFRDDVNAGNNYAGKYIKLTANIDLADEEWEPIGYMGKNFVGNFDGGNNTISNLVITKTLDNASANNGIGFFGRTDSPAVIKNLTIENVEITGSLYVGAVVGYGYTGKAIENVTVKGDIAIDAWWYAGVIGGNGYMSLVNNCHVIGNNGSYIKGNNGSYIGGIWGFRGEGDNKITNCTVTNLNITGVDRVGGICGIGHYGNTVSGCAVDSVSIEATDPEATTVGLIVGACQGTSSEPSVFKENTVTETTAKAGDTVVESIYGTNINGSTAVTNYTVSIGNKVYETLADAAAVATSGDTITLMADAEIAEGTDVTIPDGVTLNGNGYSVLASGADHDTTTNFGYVIAGGNLTIEGITRIEKFSAGYYDHVITIGEGASLDVFGKNRVSFGYGSSFYITGNIADAKTIDKATVKPSLNIAAGISIVGSDNTVFEAKNAYVVLGSSSSKNSNAGGVFDISFDNCIVEFTNQFTFATPKYDTLNPTFNVNVKDSVMTVATKLCMAATGSNVTVDNSTVTLGTYLHNSGTLTVKNGSKFTGSMIQYGENGGNSGNIIVDGSDLNIKCTSVTPMDGKTTGKVTLENNATANITSIKASEINVDATSKLTTEKLHNDVTVNVDAANIPANTTVTVVEQTEANAATLNVTLTNGAGVEVDYADGDVKLTKSALPNAEICNTQENVWTVTDTDVREAFNVQLKNVTAYNSLKVESYSGDTLLATTTLKEGKYPVVNSEWFTVNVVLWGDASSSWNNVIETENITEDNIPDNWKVYCDGILVAEGSREMSADWVAAYKGLDCVVEVATAVATVDGVEYTDLQEAINAANSKTVVLLNDVALDTTLTISAGTVVTLDLNGYTVSYTSDIVGEAMITNRGELTINDSSAEADGAIVYTYTGAPDTSYGKGNYTISNVGKLTLNAGTVENATDAMSHACYAIDNNSINSAATLIINDGKVLNTNNYAIRQIAGNKANNVTVNGGKIEGTRAIWIQLPGSSTSDAPEVNLTVTGGTLIGTKVDSSDNKLAVYSYSYGNDMAKVSINISGGTFDGDVALTGGKNKTNIETVNITGGTFTGRWGEVYSYGNDELATKAISITGGTFATDAAEMYASDDGYEFKANADGTYGVVEVEYDTWDTKGGFIKGLPDEQNSITMLLVVGIQGRSYAEAGFEVTVGDTVVPMPTNVVYTKINIKDAEGKLIDSLVGSTFGENNDYILCAKVLLPTDFNGAAISFRAYLVDYEGNKMYAKNTNGSLDYVGTIGRVVNN